MCLFPPQCLRLTFSLAPSPPSVSDVQDLSQQASETGPPPHLHCYTSVRQHIGACRNFLRFVTRGPHVWHKSTLSPSKAVGGGYYRQQTWPLLATKLRWNWMVQQWKPNILNAVLTGSTTALLSEINFHTEYSGISIGSHHRTWIGIKILWITHMVFRSIVVVIFLGWWNWQHVKIWTSGNMNKGLCPPGTCPLATSTKQMLEALIMAAVVAWRIF